MYHVVWAITSRAGSRDSEFPGIVLLCSKQRREEKAAVSGRSEKRRAVREDSPAGRPARKRGELNSRDELIVKVHRYSPIVNNTNADPT